MNLQGNYESLYNPTNPDHSPYGTISKTSEDEINEMNIGMLEDELGRPSPYKNVENLNKSISLPEKIKNIENDLNDIKLRLKRLEYPGKPETEEMRKEKEEREIKEREEELKEKKELEKKELEVKEKEELGKILQELEDIFNLEKYDQLIDIIRVNSTNKERMKHIFHQYLPRILELDSGIFCDIFGDIHYFDVMGFINMSSISNIISTLLFCKDCDPETKIKYLIKRYSLTKKDVFGKSVYPSPLNGNVFLKIIFTNKYMSLLSFIREEFTIEKEDLMVRNPAHDINRNMDPYLTNKSVISYLLVTKDEESLEYVKENFGVTEEELNEREKMLAREKEDSLVNLRGRYGITMEELKEYEKKLKENKEEFKEKKKEYREEEV